MRKGAPLPIESAFEAGYLFHRTYGLLAGDNAGRVDWDTFLRLAVAYWVSVHCGTVPEGDDIAVGRWVEETSATRIPSEVPFTLASARRLGEAFALWRANDLSGADSGVLDAGLTLLLSDKLQRSGLTIISPRTAELIMEILRPEPGQQLYCICRGTGEVEAAFLRLKMAEGGGSGIQVTTQNPWASLHRITRLRELMGAGGPWILEAQEIRESVPQTPPVRWLVYASLIDELEDRDTAGRAQHMDALIRRLLRDAPTKARIALLVPEVVLNGATWTEMRSFLIKVGCLRLIAQLPPEALMMGSAKVGVILLEKEETWPPRVGVILADIPHVSGDLSPDSIVDVGRALSGHRPLNPDVWYQELLSADRLDPRYHRNREVVERTLEKMQTPVKPLGDLLVEVQRGQSGGPFQGKGTDLLVQPAAISALCIQPSQCRTAPSPYGVQLPAGAVLLTVSGPIGRSAVVPENLVGARAGAGVAVLLPKSHLLDARYLAVLFESELGQQMLALITKGTHRPFLPLHELRHLRIPLPTLERQRRIAEEALEHYAQARSHRLKAVESEEMARQTVI